MALSSLCCGSLSLKICVTTTNVQHPLARNLLSFSTPGRPTMDKSKKRKVSEENRTFNSTTYASFVAAQEIVRHRKGFVAPGVFFSVGNGSKWLFECLRLQTPELAGPIF